jgi:hypothetical protein
MRELPWLDQRFAHASPPRPRRRPPTAHLLSSAL